MPELLNEIQAAEMLHHQPSTLQKWRLDRKGPNYIKIGRKIFYEPSEIEKFIRSRRVNLTRH